MIDSMLILALILTGLFVSFLCSMVGLGGGVLFIPLLILVFKVPANMAIGISIFSMTMTTLSATIGYTRNRCVDWRLAVAYDVFDIPGIMLGAYLTIILPEKWLEVFCGIAIVIIASLVIFKKKRDPVCELPMNEPSNAENGEVENACEEEITLKDVVEGNRLQKEQKKAEKAAKKKGEKVDPNLYKSAWTGSNLKWVIISSFMGGLVTGMVGLGGGTVDTTTMILLGVPVNTACGSSSLAMLLTNVVGFLSHAELGNILWDYALPLGLASLVGAQVGSHIAPKIDGSILKRLLGIIAMFTGFRLLFSISYA